MRAILGALILGAGVGAAMPRELTITDQQQQAVYVICEKAARSPANSLDELVDIGIFCRNWRDLVTKNSSPPPAPPAPAPPPGTEEK